LLKPWPSWIADFEHFKREFLKWADAYLEEWSIKYGVSKPSVHIIPDDKLDPWEVGAVYVTLGVKHSGVTGPAIIFREGYLRDLFGNAWKKQRFEEMWNYLLWTLAHEFGHHMRILPKPSLLVAPFPMIREAKRRMEISASLMAYSLTGKTATKHNWDFLMVTGETRPRYFARQAFEWRRKGIR